MSFKKIEVSLASAVASAGTFTASYPADTTAGDYAAYGHSMFCRGLQAMFTQDLGGMSVSFGASDITVTHRGSTSIPAGSVVDLQFNMAGPDDKQLPDISKMNRMNIMTPVLIDLGAPDAADDNGIVESQSLTAAGVYSTLAFNGVYGDPYSNTKAVLDVPRNVVAAWTTNAVLTVTGKDEYGDIIVEKSAGGSASFTGKKAFKEITSITTDTNITSLTVGTGDVLGLPVYVDKVGRIVAELKDGVVIPSTGGHKVYVSGKALEAAIDAGTSLFLASPVAGVIRKATAQVNGTITTGGTITVEVNTTEVAGLGLVIADGAVAAAVVTDTPTAGSATAVVAVGDDIEFVFPSAFNASADIELTLEIDATYALDGTFVAGVQTLPTATTGDVKGTYDPSSACDGALQFGLLALLPDPTYKGVDNYDG